MAERESRPGQRSATAVQAGGQSTITGNDTTAVGGAQEAAKRYLARGWAPVPVPHRSKNPGFDEWQKLRVDENNLTQYFNGRPQNIGILLGAPSHGLVDVDLDCAESIALAPWFLPGTDAKFGRRSKPQSHWEYIADPLIETAQFVDPKTVKKFLELRSTGGQTVFPPSTHEEGESITWAREGEPTRIDGHQLLAAVRKLAAASLLARYWPRQNGSRQDIALALAGGLLRGGWATEDVDHFLRAVAIVAGDEESAKRAKAAEYTAKKVANDQKVTGWPTLARLVDERVVRRLGEWLGTRFTPSSSTGFHFTDLGNAERLIERHGADLAYCHPWAKWYVWDGKRWAEDDTAEVERRAAETVRAIYAEASGLPDKSDREKLIKWALQSESDSRLRAMLNRAKAIAGVPVLPDALDLDPWLLAVQNGVIDLHTGMLLPHERADLITKVLPIEYDHAAECPTFLAFLNKILDGNADLVGFLQRSFGYTLTGTTRERVIFICHGTGANGKTTLLRTLHDLLGDYAVRTPTKTLLAKKDDGIPNDVARLRGARFVYASESEEGRRLAEAFIKDLTGNDPLSARFLHREWFQFVPQCKVWLGTNHKPVITGSDKAIWDRIRLIPFTVRIPEEEQDKALGDKLKAEAPGILRWAVEGCLDWLRNGLGTPQEVKDATAGYRSEMDAIANFLDDCCLVDVNAQVNAKALHTSFVDWCKQNNERVISQRALRERLLERGMHPPTPGAGGRYFWRGLGLASNPILPVGEEEAS